MNELLRNGSGYYDPTAYNAMTNIIKSEKVKKVNSMKQGEIWEIKQNSGGYRNVIVLAVNGNVSTVLQINDSCSNDYEIEINCQGIKYTDPRKIQYAFDNTFTTFIRTLKTEEFEKVMDAVADSLGLSNKCTEEAVVPVDIQEELIQFRNKPVIKPSADTLKFNPIKSEELIKAESERDIYKGLYEKLLADVMKGA